MFIVAMVPIWFWRNMSGVAYLVAFVLLLVVENSAPSAWARSAGSTLASSACSRPR
jgi:hypothetical protein